MKRVLLFLIKAVFGIIFFLAVVFYILANHSTTQYELTCNGKWQRSLENQPERVHVVLREYKRWSHFWTESDGDVSVQAENLKLPSFIPFVEKTGVGSLSLFLFLEEGRGKLLRGFRVANGEITILFQENLLFVGTCGKRVEL